MQQSREKLADQGTHVLLHSSPQQAAEVVLLFQIVVASLCHWQVLVRLHNKPCTVATIMSGHSVEELVPTFLYVDWFRVIESTIMVEEDHSKLHTAAFLTCA